MKLKTRIVLVALLMVATAWADSSGFEKVPAQAMTELKGARGKKLDTGLVFVNGHYLKPPYVVARYGTAIYVNDIQVTDQIVPWRNFLATQEGYVAPTKPAAPATPAAPAAPAASEAKSLDDLFDDAAPEPEAQPKPAAEPAAAAPQEELKIAFKPNAHTAELLKRIDAARTDVQRKLREGNACFFGANYARVIIEQRLVKPMMAVLPEGMGEANNAEELESILRRGGIVFLHRRVCKDLLDHRADYLQLRQRRKDLLEAERKRQQSGQELSL